MPGRGLVLRRNPNYSGPRPSRLAEIRIRTGVRPERAVAAVEAGRADYAVLNPPGDPAVSAATERRLVKRYGPGSEAARAGRQQLFTQPAPNIYFFIFNTRRGPFADVRLRRAVNFAMDRRALALHTGLGETGRPTDQHIPPGLPGFEDAAIYPLGGPDLPAARRLAGTARRRAVLYTCNFPACSRHGQILRSNLSAIGIDLEVREFPIPELFERLQRRGRALRHRLLELVLRLRRPSSYINVQFADQEGFYRLFEDARWQRRMDSAARLSGPTADPRLREARPRARGGGRAGGAVRHRNRHLLPVRADGLPGPAPDLRARPGHALRPAPLRRRARRYAGGAQGWATASESSSRKARRTAATRLSSCSPFAVTSPRVAGLSGMTRCEGGM